MDNKSRSSSNISLDSLENDFKRESLKQKPFEENVDTILVPLYERDVLIKVPKRKKKQNQCDDKCKKNNFKSQKESNELTNYLVNKDSRRVRKTSYLEMFRKQFTSNSTESQNKTNINEIRSISPEFGDTERESIGNESYTHGNDFYNTESYNDIYYDKLMKRELQQYLEQSFEEILHFDEDLSKFPDNMNDNNLRSVSEVSQPRRRLKSKMISPIQNVHLGGLGPDIEKIKPRLERARSLQRYSEKVRMENRLKIYKKEVQDEKAEREASTTRRPLIAKTHQKDNKNTYLFNKSFQENTPLIKKICHSKSKSADVQKFREREEKKPLAKNEIEMKNDSEKNKKEKLLKVTKAMDQKKTLSAKGQCKKGATEDRSLRLKSNYKFKKSTTESKQNEEVSPLKISFMVNVGGVRPSTALRSLEEKHRMYQEKVKQYSTSINNI
ncbi:unnamed protein product [Euphydryas editha]|uniref:Uncharacterized protein n=1 Tax=Euphydryas editha TaxID=104508 RepID=A0AAU9TZH5_EUPED|nr:unnamed protein product [Euphydryas editha]